MKRRGKPLCGHDHSDDPLQGLVCSTIHALKKKVPKGTGFVVMAIEDDGGEPSTSCSVFATKIECYFLAKGILETMTTVPKCDCGSCKSSHSALVAALDALQKGLVNSSGDDAGGKLHS